MATKINRIPFNTLPQKIAFDPELGPLFREILTILWQQRERSGGDVDDIADLIARITTAEGDIDAVESDISALQSADAALDLRVDALELSPGTHADTVEYDFGTSPVYDAQFTITDAAISASSVVSVVPGGAATGRTGDDWQWDGATVGVVPGSGTATCYVTFHPGPIVGPRTFNYTVI